MMESKVRLKERVARIFWPSPPGRKPSGQGSPVSITSSSAAAATTPSASNRCLFAASSSRSLFAATSSRSFSFAASDIVHEPIFIPRSRRNDSDELPLVIPHRSVSSDGLSRRLLMSGGCGGCRPAAAAPSSEKKDKRERRDGSVDGRICPPTSPSSVSNIYCQYYDCFNEEEANKLKRRKKKKKKKKKKRIKKNMKWRIRSNRHNSRTSSNSFDSVNDEEKEETETFFSSRSFSSDSSEFYRRPTAKPKMNSTKKTKNKEGEKPRGSSRRPPRRYSAKLEVEGQNGFAFVKKSSDPYGDFRSSMVEMIVERRIFGGRELERLLHAYLSLNSPENHPVILRAFADISEVLFSF